ncbi:MAG: hypothetical protein Q8T13_13695 [Acidobacteriota bacterium]|nr:hypothetical protein [Acidobacteriota bacterium]
MIFQPNDWPHPHVTPRSEQERDRLLTVVPDRLVFVFGSNLAGRHMGGAARDAVDYFEAEMGKGYGWHGRSYAIPTMDVGLRTLPLHFIAGHVDRFLVAAMAEPDFTFYVTAVGTGIAGLTHEQMAPFFVGAPSNVLLPVEWLPLLSAQATTTEGARP